MKITNKVEGLTTFKNIKVGEWFVDVHGDVGMRIDYVYGGKNCIYYTKGGTHGFAEMDDDECVYFVEVEFVVTEAR